MKEIDARGIECPMPVIMAKRLVKEGLDEFKVLVDEKIAVDNLKKMAKQVSYDVLVSEENSSDFKLSFKKSVDKKASGEDLTINCKANSSDNYLVVFDDEGIGNGDPEFSKKLLESFLLALSEADNLPKYVICYNKGVFLTSLRENTIEDFKKLEEAGVKILSCGLCLDYYKLKDDLKVGSISNMYEIVDLMTQFRVVRP
ncbi:MAG: sulfurtransferase-like selenium metabolism protein YedF [Anaerococcus sp.]|nr:sulfurtransferase-like selenium metabolism protein YedF [Anaerococcus sp.]